MKERRRKHDDTHYPMQGKGYRARRPKEQRLGWRCQGCQTTTALHLANCPTLESNKPNAAAPDGGGGDSGPMKSQMEDRIAERLRNYAMTKVSAREADELEEDADERRMFNDTCKTFGGPLGAVAMALQAWGRAAPQQGSFAQQCYIMANEVRRAAADERRAPPWCLDTCAAIVEAASIKAGHLPKEAVEAFVRKIAETPDGRPTASRAMRLNDLVRDARALLRATPGDMAEKAETKP